MKFEEALKGEKVVYREEIYRIYNYKNFNYYVRAFQPGNNL